jgi:hypothetical protein
VSKCLAVFFLATSAQAAYLDYSATYLDFLEIEFVDENPRLSLSYSEAIPRFNPALGKLRSVTVALDLQYDWFWSVHPTSSVEMMPDGCAFSWLTGTIGQPGWGTLVSEYINAPDNGDCGFQQPDGSISGGVLPRQTYWRQYADDPNSQIGFFIGYVPIPFEAGFYFSGYPPKVTGGSYAGTVSLRVDAAATVLYDYEEAPEPSLLLPLGLGLLLMGAQQWRRGARRNY